MTKRIHVVGAAILKDGLYLAARRGAQMRLAGLWEFPGGKVEDGETPKEGLAREIREELGIEVDVGDFVATGVVSVSEARMGGELSVSEARIDGEVSVSEARMGGELSVSEARMGGELSVSEGRIVELDVYVCTWRAGSIELVEHDEIVWVAPSEMGKLRWAEADWPAVVALGGVVSSSSGDGDLR